MAMSEGFRAAGGSVKELRRCRMAVRASKRAEVTGGATPGVMRRSNASCTDTQAHLAPRMLAWAVPGTATCGNSEEGRYGLAVETGDSELRGDSLNLWWVLLRQRRWLINACTTLQTADKITRGAGQGLDALWHR
jgi:hypothetical protein